MDLWLFFGLVLPFLSFVLEVVEEIMEEKRDSEQHKEEEISQFQKVIVKRQFQGHSQKGRDYSKKDETTAKRNLITQVPFWL